MVILLQPDDTGAEGWAPVVVPLIMRRKAFKLEYLVAQCGRVTTGGVMLLFHLDLV